MYASKFWVSAVLITVHRCKHTDLFLSTISIKHAYSEGTAVSLVADWLFPIFLNVADCELLYPLVLFLLTMPFNYRCHDHAGVCNVESIQRDPL